MRFGLWELDVSSQARRKRPAPICTPRSVGDGLSSEMVTRYAPEIFDKLFPS